MGKTFPNQKIIKINREAAKSDFLGIKNSNWQAAAIDLGAHALMLYLYLASNANGYSLALSPAAILQAIGMPRSTYQDQFQKLIKKGYLVQENGNTYNFYEKPQQSHTDKLSKNQEPTDGLNFNECTSADNSNTSAVQNKPRENIEINNINIKNNKINNQNFSTNGLPTTTDVYIPKVVEIVIPPPRREDKTQKNKLQRRKEFKF